jgi:hypothetical protein
MTLSGVTYDASYDTPDNPIPIPVDEPGLVAEWEGSIEAGNLANTGRIGVLVGPFNVRVASWGGGNSEDVRATRGTYAIDDFWDELGFKVVGIYEMTGTHRASGGDCEGSVYVDLQGDALSTPFGMITVGGLVLTGLGVLAAGIPGRKRRSW